MKRYHVILGTKTTADGEVISASSTRTLNGVKFALEGDKIYCPACQSEGVIRCHGPRLNDTWNGINFALEHDLCICSCKTPPTLLAAQSFSSQTVDGDRFAFGAGSAAASHEDCDYDQHFVFEDQDGQPLADIPYRLVAKSGSVVEGKTDASGKTQAVSGDVGETLDCSVTSEVGT